MVKTKKVFVVVCFLWLVSLGFAAPVYAGEQESAVRIEISPFWSHTVSIRADLHINNSGRATMSGMVIANTGTTHIVANAVLERVNPNGTITRIASFNNLRANGDLWAWERSHYVARGHDYRVTITATVHRNGQTETVSISSGTVRAR